jgi:phage/conjugal plasmid C-4 type zinc finger TraR family protein
MSDEIDRANDTAEFNLQVALAKHKQQTGKTSLEFCDFCGVPIPEARRLAVPGVDLCVDCQSDEERREKYR